MKVESVNPALAHVSVTSAAPKVSSSAQTSTHSVAQDRTSFHSDSTSVQALASQALKSPEVRQDKVDALRKSVRSDAYQLDANRLADSISGSGGK